MNNNSKHYYLLAKQENKSTGQKFVAFGGKIWSFSSATRLSSRAKVGGKNKRGGESSG